MNRLTARRMAKVVAAAQPFCDEKITGAITCNQDGPAGTAPLTGTFTTLAEEMGLGVDPDHLPSPVLLAVDFKWIHAFHYVPKWTKLEALEEVARWSRSEARFAVQETSTAIYLAIGTRSSASHIFEISAMTAPGARHAHAFLTLLGVGESQGLVVPGGRAHRR